MTTIRILYVVMLALLMGCAPNEKDLEDVAAAKQCRQSIDTYIAEAVKLGYDKAPAEDRSQEGALHQARHVNYLYLYSISSMLKSTSSAEIQSALRSPECSNSRVSLEKPGFLKSRQPPGRTTEGSAPGNASKTSLPFQSEQGCNELGDIAANAWSTRSQGTSLQTVLTSVAQIQMQDPTRKAAAEGVIVAIYGDLSISSREHAFQKAYAACSK